MNLSDYELTVGVVAQATDYTTCTIKWCSTDQFSANVSIDECLSAYPFAMYGNKQVFHLKIGYKVWILHNKLNDSEYWYIPMWETDNNVYDRIDPNNNSGNPSSIHNYCDNGINQSGIIQSEDGSQTLFADGATIKTTGKSTKINVGGCAATFENGTFDCTGNGDSIA